MSALAAGRMVRSERVRGVLGLAALASMCVAVLLASSGGRWAERLSMKQPVEPMAHPPLRAITRIPRSHGYTDAVDFGTLPTASSRVVREDDFLVCVCVVCVWNTRVPGPPLLPDT